MAESVYQVLTVVGTSTESWEAAAKAAVEKVSRTTRDLRVAEIVELDIKLENGKTSLYRAKVRVSFRVENIEERQFYKDPTTWFLEKEHHSLDG